MEHSFASKERQSILQEHFKALVQAKFAFAFVARSENLYTQVFTAFEKRMDIQVRTIVPAG